MERKANATESGDKQDFADRKTALDILRGLSNWSNEQIKTKLDASTFDNANREDKYIAKAIDLKLRRESSTKASEDAQKAMAKLSMNNRETENQEARPREDRHSEPRKTSKHHRDHSPRAGESSKKHATDSTKTGSSKPPSHSTATGSTHGKRPEPSSSRPTNHATASSSKPHNPPVTTGSTHSRHPEPSSSRPTDRPTSSASIPNPPKPTTVVASSSNSTSGPVSKADFENYWRLDSNKKFRCTKGGGCEEKIFIDKVRYKRHFNTVHAIDRTLYRCPFGTRCTEKEFNREDSFGIHLDSKKHKALEAQERDDQNKNSN